MYKSILIIILNFLIICDGYSLSDSSTVSVLTYEPGNELYTIFGHTAIRISDQPANLDRIYNFGTFDFSSPFFYIRFIRGNLDYFLSVYDFNTLMHQSCIEKRKIHEQVLDMSAKEKDQLYYKLEQCYHSSDRFYQYDFFYDNCATRVRDAVFTSMATEIQYDTSAFCCQTFRQLLNPYLTGNYWVNIGVNLALGKRADKTATSFDFMFIPDYIMGILGRTTRVGEESSSTFREQGPIQVQIGLFPRPPGLFSRYCYC